jgi:hypothetical protein
MCITGDNPEKPLYSGTEHLSGVYRSVTKKIGGFMLPEKNHYHKSMEDCTPHASDVLR